MPSTCAHLDQLQAIFASVCADFEVELREFNGERDHVHLPVFHPPKVRLSELVNSLKGVSSRLLKKEFPEIASFWSVKKSRYRYIYLNISWLFPPNPTTPRPCFT